MAGLALLLSLLAAYSDAQRFQPRRSSGRRTGSFRASSSSFSPRRRTSPFGGAARGRGGRQLDRYAGPQQDAGSDGQAEGIDFSGCETDPETGEGVRTEGRMRMTR